MEVVSLNDVMSCLTEASPDVTIAQVRWAIASGQVTRPPLDGSLRFDFGEQHLKELIRYFARAADALQLDCTPPRFGSSTIGADAKRRGGAPDPQLG
jgi:hypothetical protein